MDIFMLSLFPLFSLKNRFPILFTNKQVYLDSKYFSVWSYNLRTALHCTFCLIHSHCVVFLRVVFYSNHIQIFMFLVYFDLISWQSHKIHGGSCFKLINTGWSRKFHIHLFSAHWYFRAYKLFIKLYFTF